MSQRQQERGAPAPSQTTTTPRQPETRTQAPRILRLRGAHGPSERSVQWAEDVVDNEGLGRKSSKVCCIYHRPKAVDESSDESSSSDSSDDDSDSGHEGAQPAGGKKAACGHSHGGRGRGKKSKKGKDRAPSPNAYEKIPKVKPKDESGGNKA